ncbi:hypothetical protein VIGAN_08059000 [Vigna angularis var. angularis]|uniref:Alkyl hydroperoxide reductase subunit C/ Thiol specific antioxidant domain-containing protein n=1 Tax=Vigna angularis var. angularis TaxID=157739 RepID=A0A0S3SML6_PHAAN|nr:hypothetical protein VIGAN_08059000 [Vigna angularis var. angularis]
MLLTTYNVIIVFSHLAWVQTDRKSDGLGYLKYPLISDITKSISKSFGVLIPDQYFSNCRCQRSIFLIADVNNVVTITLLK